jgi:predicted nuclease of predicted toxin-antitoxin system
LYSNGISDAEILEIPREHQEVVVTHDLDFGTQLAFSGKETPSVVIFRVHHINTEVFFQLFSAAWETIEEPLEIGALVVIEKLSVRVRFLPIR